MLQDHEAIKQLGHILKTNVRACTAVGHPFVIQLGRIYLDMLNVYKVLSENISSAVALNGACVCVHTRSSLPATLSYISLVALCYYSLIPKFDIMKEHYWMCLELVVQDLTYTISSGQNRCLGGVHNIVVNEVGQW